MIYLDSSVALAHLLAEDRFPPELLWDQPLVSSRLLECEVWNRINAHQLQSSHGEAVRNLIGRIAMIEVVGPVLPISIVWCRFGLALHLITPGCPNLAMRLQPICRYG